MSFKTKLMTLGIKMSKHAPTILVVGGVAVGVAAAVIAVKNTPKLHDVMTEDKKSLAKIKENEEDPTAKFVVEQGETDDEPTLYAPYDHEVAEYDRKEVYKHMTVMTLRAYALPVGMGLLSMLMIFKGYKMKCAALGAMTVAYNSTLAGYKTYRKRVVERFGEDVDRDILLGKTTEVVETTDEEGNISVEEKEVINPINGGTITFVIDGDNPYYRNDISTMRDFIEMTQRYAHNLYNNRNTNHLYLHELTDSLGIDRDDVLPYSGMGWSEKLDKEQIELKLDISGSAYFDKDEDGKVVCYIPITVDGVIS